ncbi:MAG: AraC family transcriptional regulator [Acetivibrionales bacterium]|jgi:AraC-like DNA-binding protein
MDISYINPCIIRCSNTASENGLTNLVSYPQRTVCLYELEYITKGGGYIIVNGEKCPAETGTVFIRTPGMVVQGFLPYCSYCILWENIDGFCAGKSRPADAFPEHEIHDSPRFPSFSYSVLFPEHHPIKDLFKSVYEIYLTDDKYAQILMKSNVLQIMYHILSLDNNVQSDKLQSMRLHMHRIELLYEYIETNLHRTMSLAELANACQLSKGFLCRLFKQTNGITLFSYINNTRIQRARRLLIETELPIKDISIQCGFENETYFYRMFKRKMHISPIAYRKLHRQPYV